MIDFSVFLTADAWITLVTLLFLEIVLGIDNIVFISITTDRLPKNKQHIGRIAGLAGAFVMRCLFLSVASWLTHMTNALFTLDLGFWSHGFSIRDIILLLGGAYLVYKGIDELAGLLRLNELKAKHSPEAKANHQIGLVQAVGTIMVMDIVFSIDSVITAVGLANDLLIMILAVLIAILIMMVFIDAISNFINTHAEMKILALVFIAAIGVLLVLDALGITTGIEVLGMHMEKLMVYFAMLFSIMIVCIIMGYNGRKARFLAEHPEAAAALAAENAKEEKASDGDAAQGEAAKGAEGEQQAEGANGAAADGARGSETERE